MSYMVSVLVNDETTDPTPDKEVHSSLSKAKHAAAGLVTNALDRGFELIVRKPYRSESTTSWMLRDGDGDRVRIVINKT